MTIVEFSNQFDILYDNVASKGAPGLDLYEKSVYLTKAQLELVKTHYSQDNKYRQGFEGSEKRRVDLKELITNHNSTTQITSSNGISSSSKFFSIPDDVFLIIQETATINDTTNTCITNKIVDVLPKTHDEYNTQIKNPFKRPDENLVWRIDYSRQNNNKNVELVSPFDITNYHVRYIKYPEPIILTDISSGDFQGESLSIEGQTSARTSQLDESFHDEILDRAVQLAVRDYREASLQGKIQTDLRNE